MAAGDFSFVLIPDAQNLVTTDAPHLVYWDGMIDWIITNKDTKAIKAVIGLGDITNWGDSEGYMVRALNGSGAKGLQLVLNAGIPLILPPGNHDYTDGNSPGGTANGATPRQATWFNTYFGDYGMAAQPEFQGTYSPGDYANTYLFVDVDEDHKFLLLALECFPRTAVINWAKGLIEANPNRQVFITTHAYLVDSQAANGVGILGPRTGPSWNAFGPANYTGMTASDLSGSEIWDALVKKYPNVLAVVNGHYLSRNAGTTGNAAYLKGIGDSGNYVHQLFANWQEFEQLTPQGRIVLLTFSPTTNAITAECIRTDTSASVSMGAGVDTSWEWNSGTKRTSWRGTLTVPASKVSSVGGANTFNNFPVLLTEVNLPTGIFDYALEGGGDLRFYADERGNTPLPCEVQKFDTANSKAIVWVAVNVSSLADTVFYIRCGGANTTQPVATSTYGRNAVWANYLAVWHLDSKTESKGLYPLTAVGVEPALAAGKIGNAYTFDRTGHLSAIDFRRGGYPGALTYEASFSCWYKMPDVVTGERRVCFEGGVNYFPSFGWRNESGMSNQAQSYAFSRYTTTNVDISAVCTVTHAVHTPDANWTHVNMRFRPRTAGTKVLSLVFNGSTISEEGTNNAVADGTLGAYQIDKFNIGFSRDTSGITYADRAFRGQVAEMRIYDSFQSNDLAKTEYDSMNDPAAFVTAGVLTTRDIAWTDWKYRVKVSIPHRMVGNDGADSAVVKFPVLLSEANLPSSIFDKAADGGGDLRFSSDVLGWSRLACEVVYFDRATQKAQVWVARDVSPIADTDIYLWCGNAGQTQPVATDTYGRNAVWDDNYIGVWHLDGASLPLIDSTGTATNNITSSHGTNPVLASPGKFGKCVLFDGANDYLDAENLSFTALPEYTVSLWTRMPDLVGTRRVFLEGGTAYTPHVAWRNDLDGPLPQALNRFQNYVSLVGGSDGSGVAKNIVPAPNTWYHLTSRFSKVLHALKLAVNGVQGVGENGEQTYLNDTTDASLVAGLHFGTYRTANDRYHKGELAEVRYSNTYRSEAWILTEYNSMNNPATFARSGPLLSPESGNTNPSIAISLGIGL